jgi:hypothetical protein
MKTGGSISIWFFVGLSLLVNGILIFGAGIFELVRPPEAHVVLYNLHAGVWWGGLMTAIGAIYCFHFLPRKAGKQ